MSKGASNRQTKSELGQQGSLKRGTLMVKLRLDEFFAKKKTSSFKTAEQFFDTSSHGFMPMTALYNPEGDRSMYTTHNKFRINKWKSEIEEDAYKVCREGKFRKTILREAYHLFTNSNHIDILKTHSLAPSDRPSQTVSNKIETKLPIDSHRESGRWKEVSLGKVSKGEKEKSKGIRTRMTKMTKRVLSRAQRPVADSITGWNWLEDSENVYQ